MLEGRKEIVHKAFFRDSISNLNLPVEKFCILSVTDNYDGTCNVHVRFLNEEINAMWDKVYQDFTYDLEKDEWTTEDIINFVKSKISV